MGFSDTLKKLDIFGGQRGLTFSGEESHKTLVGAFLTVIYLLMIVFFMILYINDFTTRHEQPRVNSKKLITETSSHLDFKENQFFFSIGLLYKGVYVKPSEIQKILDITITQYTTEFNAQSTLEFKPTTQKMRECTEEDFTFEGDIIIANPDKSPAIFSVCVDNKKPDNETLKIDGEFYTAGKSYVNLEIRPCEGSDCRNDLNTIIQSERLEIIFGVIEVSINPDNFEKPYKYHYNSDREFSLFNSKTYVRKLFFEKTQIVSDIGLFQSEEEEKPSMGFKQEMNQDRDRVGSNDPYIIMNFYSSNDIFEITRDYDKFQDLLAKIGGVLSIMTLAMGIIYGFYNETSLKLDIMNKALIKDKQKTLSFFSVIKFILYKILSLTGCKKCFSQRTRELATMYFNADERVNNYLEVKAIVNNTRDVRLFRRIFFNKYQTHLLQKIENDTLLVETDTHYLDEEEIKINNEEVQKYLKENQNSSDDVDRRINRFFFKLNKKVEEEKEKLEKEANSKYIFI